MWLRYKTNAGSIVQQLHAEYERRGTEQTIEHRPGIDGHRTTGTMMDAGQRQREEGYDEMRNAESSGTCGDNPNRALPFTRCFRLDTTARRLACAEGN